MQDGLQSLPARSDRLSDGGPIYTETDLDQLIVEPFNAASNLVFLALVVYWSLRVYRGPDRNPFLGACLPILFVGFVGGTVYHAFRAHPVWLLLDWLPIFGLTVAASVRYLRRLSPTWRVVAGAYGGPFIGLGLLASFLPPGLRSIVMPALGYATLAGWVAVPVVVHLARHPDRTRWPVAVAIALFLVAITFRSIDRFAPPPFDDVGTHFLWHVFGAASAHFIILFLYWDDRAARLSGEAYPA